MNFIAQRLLILVFCGLMVMSAPSAQASMFDALPPQPLYRGMVLRFYGEAISQVAQQGGITLAAQLMAKIYAMDPTDFRTALVYGGMLESLDPVAEAKPFYESLLTTATDPLVQATLEYKLGLIADIENDTNTAIRRLSHAISLAGDKTTAMLYYDLGVMYAKQNRYEETWQWSKKATEKDPAMAPAWNNLGYSLARVGRYQEGGPAVEKALSLEPNNPNTLDSKGYILFLSGRFEEAAVAYERAVLIEPTLAESLLYLGRAYEKLEAWDKAIAAYESYLRHTKDAAEAKVVEKQLKRLQLRRLTQPASTLPSASSAHR